MDHFQSTGQTRRASLRKLLLESTGQDVSRCRGCGSCNSRQNFTALDISLDSLIQLVIQDDEEVLTSRTLWSDEVYEAIYYSCQRGLDLRAIFDALRAEANFRNLR
jgi:hypothetical protein